MKNFKNGLVKKTVILLLIGALGISVFSSTPTIENGMQLCTILKDSQGTY